MDLVEDFKINGNFLYNCSVNYDENVPLFYKNSSYTVS